MTAAAEPSELPATGELIMPVFGYAVFQIISSISRLGVPAALGTGTRTPEELATELGADTDFLRRLLRAGAALGMLTVEAGRFGLTPLGALYRPGGAWDAAVHDATHAHPAVWAAWGSLEGAVRSGIPGFVLTHGRGLFSYLDDDAQLAADFHETMATGTALQTAAIVAGYDFSRFATVVDVGGGDGTFMAAILAAHPTARGTVYDQENAIRHAPPVLERAGVSQRCDLVAGDFMTSVPAGADLVALKSVVHDWDDAHVSRLLDNCRRAMSPQSRLVMFTWLGTDPENPMEGEDSGERLAMAIQDIELMIMTRGEIRTVAAYDALFAASGLRIESVSRIDCPFTLHAIEAVPVV